MILLPHPAYAYLDPGTGNALVYMVLSFLGALLFSLKSIFYKIVGNKDDFEGEEELKAHRNKIVLFSEGKNYWHTYKPVVEALLKEKVFFSYYTMDVEDPCLTIDAPTMDNRFIGSGNRAFAKMGNLKAGVVLTTTPNIGTAGYPIPRSGTIGKLVHVFHSFDDPAIYHKGSLDNYDAVMLVGDFAVKGIRHLEKLRGTRRKDLIPAGLPYLDELADAKERWESENRQKNRKNVPTVLVAPSWGAKGCLSHYGWEFIELLAKEGFEVIIRPHPQALKVEADMLKEIRASLVGYENVKWDYEVDATPSMERADIMISDTSSVRMDFLLIYRKPVISLAMQAEDMEEYELADMGTSRSWKDEQIARLGCTVNEDELGKIADIVRKQLSNENFKEEIEEFRKNNLYNWRESGKAIANYLVSTSEELLGHSTIQRRKG